MTYYLHYINILSAKLQYIENIQTTKQGYQHAQKAKGSSCRLANGSTVLHAVCLNGHLELAKFVVEQDPHLLREKIVGGVPVLHPACGNGHLDIAKFLVERELNLLTDKTLEGVTVLYSACVRGHLDIAKFLVDGGTWVF